ncbi:glycoside hydrolase family 76 protein [Rufibacter sediminis]|uniref:Glycoside hydrolase family 76 protein n=1 Tax=Rufibacter sediminis TaxID=2762756 RepID=A0ABR6VS56_9BACT|nr:glycoside hydrolase family 76 protein [Rufibacter sediminis]MBC3540032.1 glycoside hydrolase family 76 protein [Rufibacter sediminis]
MKKLQYFTLAALVLLFLGCGSEKEEEEEVIPTKPTETASFTAADVTTAYTAFNAHFYNPEAKLYYSTSAKTGLGAIWTQAIYWDIAMDAYNRTKDVNQLKLVNDMYQGGFQEYDGYNWNNTTEWFIYDDMMWWIISLARAHQITGNQVYLDKAKEGFQNVWGRSYDPVNGGMFWNFAKDGKNACINYPTVIAAMELYKITKDEQYLDKAKNIYAWSRANLFNNGRVADNIHVAQGNVGWSDYTYNQGTCIGAAVMLYKATGTESYLTDAKLAADYTKQKMSDAKGILPAEGDWNEQGVLKAIFGRYIMMLIKDANQPQYLPWIQDNITLAWKNRDKTRDLTFRDYRVACPTGTIQSYEASSVVGMMQVCPPKE